MHLAVKSLHSGVVRGVVSFTVTILPFCLPAITSSVLIFQQQWKLEVVVVRVVLHLGRGLKEFESFIDLL